MEVDRGGVCTYSMCHWSVDFKMFNLKKKKQFVGLTNEKIQALKISRQDSVSLSII